VFSDSGNTGDNEFSQNVGDGGLEKFRKDTLAIVAAREYKLIPGSAVHVKIWYVDSNISTSGDGKSPQEAFKTIDEALTACSDSHDDWIFVYDYSGSTATITINKSWVHLVGNRAMGNYPWPRIKPSTDVAGITLSNGKGSIEICNFKIGGYSTTSPAILCGTGVTASQVWIHDCVFGWDASTACEQALEIQSGGDMPSLLFENNQIWASNSGSGVLIAGNATRGCIRNNIFMDVGSVTNPAIYLSSGAVGVRIEDNQIAGNDDTTQGWGITLGSGTTSCWVNGNSAGSSNVACDSEAYEDAAADEANFWGFNTTDISTEMPEGGSQSGVAATPDL